MNLPLPLAITFNAFSSGEFWIAVGVIAGIYTIFTLGLQLNVGYTGLLNFGQAGFMALGAYTMAILVASANWSFWLALPASIAVAVAFGVLVGLPSLRLRADYLAIVTLAAAEIVRITIVNSRSLTGGNQGLYGFEATWSTLSETIAGWLEALGWADPPALAPLLIVVWIVAVLCAFGLSLLQRSPWGRVLRAIREDEDAVRAIGKRSIVYKMQSLCIAATLGAVAGWFLALNLNFLSPDSFDPQTTFFGYAVLVLGGLGSYWGVAVGSVIFWTLLEATRYLELPLSSEGQAALRFIIVGVVLILMMAFRPQGLFGNREEMVLGD